MRPLRFIAAAAAGIALIAGAAIGLGTTLWKLRTARILKTLAKQDRDGPLAPGFSLEQRPNVPAPVARYFQFALTPGQARIRSVRFAQTGTMRSDARQPWAHFRAVEYFSVNPPNLVWDASMSLAPFVGVLVRDSYIRGEGASEAKIAGLISVGALRGTPEASSASLIRYLAEAPWFPTALFPSDRLTWKPIDERSARATLTDATTTVTVDVHFGLQGEIASVSTLRHRDVHGELVLTPWVGRYDDYRSVQGMMIPMTAEVAWILPDGPMTCWRGRIDASAFEFDA